MEPTDDLEPTLVTAADGLRFDGAFRSPSLEDAFRRRCLAEDRVLAGACLVVPVLGGLIYTALDSHLFVLDRRFYTLLAVRLASFVVALWLWRRLRRCETPAALDRMTTLMLLLGAVLSVYVSWSRPPGYIGHAVVNVMLAGLVYSVVPLPLLSQALLVGLFSVAYVVCMPEHPAAGAGLSTRTVVGVAFAFANLLGIVNSWRLHGRRRQAFAAMVRETELRLRLEQALAEVRTLRGHLSICAWCKRVRDGQHGWQDVENYVEARTHAQFTHGICPVCFASHFPAAAEAAQDRSA